MINLIEIVNVSEISLKFDVKKSPNYSDSL